MLRTIYESRRSRSSTPLDRRREADSERSTGSRVARLWETHQTATARLRATRKEPLGCLVVRRIADERGRIWRVRELHSAAGHAILFQCELPALRSELRSLRVPLDSISDEELIATLASNDE